MMHHIEKKYGKEGESRIRLSQTLHSLNNVIEDFEISNKRYSEADKHTVRNMYLNGQLIGGLVTEDYRQDWSNMSVTDMYDKLSEEIEKIQQNFLILGLLEIQNLILEQILLNKKLVGHIIMLK